MDISLDEMRERLARMKLIADRDTGCPLSTHEKWLLQVFEELESLKTELKTAKDALRKLEWVNSDIDLYGKDYDVCPICMNDKERRHKGDCWLGTILNPKGVKG